MNKKDKMYLMFRQFLSLKMPFFTILQDGSLLYNKHPAEQWHLNFLPPTSAGKILLQLKFTGALKPDTPAVLCTDTSRCSELRATVTELPWYPGGLTCDLEVRSQRSGGQQQHKKVLFSGWNVSFFEWQFRNVKMFMFYWQGTTPWSFQKEEIKCEQF